MQKEVVWEYATDEANEVHACQPLPDGVVMVAESGPMRIVEVDRAGEDRPPSEAGHNDEGHAYPDAHAPRKLANGHYVVGQYGEGVVREYGPAGDVVREIAQKDAFSGIRLPNGNTLMAAGDAHCIRELDPAGKIVWQVGENDLPGNPLRFVAGMQRLANGNTLVCNWGGHGYVGQQPQIFEVTPEKKVVGEIYDFTQFNTISGVFVQEGQADATRYEVHR